MKNKFYIPSGYPRECKRCRAGLPKKPNATLHDIKCNSCIGYKPTRGNKK